MAAKTTGAEFKRFYTDLEFWPEGQDIWHEDEIVTVNGVVLPEYEGDYGKIADDAVVRLEGGTVIGLPDDEAPSLETYFKRWRKKQNTASFVVECDKANVEAVKAAIRTAGGRVA